jgi:hypothetical protein
VRNDDFIAGVEGMREAVLEAIKEEMEDGEPGHPWNAALETVQVKIESLKAPPPTPAGKPREESSK